MAISKDLFLAILSMDAYNEGYGAGLQIAEAPNGTLKTLGDAVVLEPVWKFCCLGGRGVSVLAAQVQIIVISAGFSPRRFGLAPRKSPDPHNSIIPKQALRLCAS